MKKKPKTSSFRAIEVFLMLMAFGWGISLLLPYETFGISVSYQAMADLANENTWGIVMLALSMVHFLSMYLDNKITKQIALNLSSGIWLFVTAMLTLSGALSTGIICYFLIGSLAAWTAVKVGVQK